MKKRAEDVISTGFDFDEGMKPFWAGNMMYNESVLMIREEDHLPSAPLLFTPVEIISVKSAAMDDTFEEGVDWFLDGCTIRLTENSKAPFMRMQDLYPSECTEGFSQPNRNRDGYVLFHEEHYFHDRQLVVTYRHGGNGSDRLIPPYAGHDLPNTVTRLTNGEPVTIALYGDSIAAGANASGLTGAPPFMPAWGDLVAEALRRSHRSAIHFYNPSVGGTSSGWGREHASDLVADKKPELVIIAFGMNDGTGGIPGDEYRGNIQSIMQTVRSENPAAEFILVAPMLANPRSCFYGVQESYKPQLDLLAGSGAVVADMTAIHSELLKRKRYEDMTGNNINHPNDFLIRWYAQVIVSLILKPSHD
jgi:lysophospholipase L1-like esterase